MTNYDYTSQLKKININDIIALTNTNVNVNESLSNFLNKINLVKK